MRPRTLEQVASAVGGWVRPVDAAGVEVRGASVDSRSAGPGDLFVALPGESSNGHRFVRHALDRGASAAMVRTGAPETEGAGPLVEVEDPGRALLDLAAAERTGLAATVVGITGSTGKTSTKDLAAAVLRGAYRVAASPGSFNNEVGLPLTVLGADPATQVLVLEMGSRGPGHIRLLCEVAAPHIGVVTNVGEAHMELFGSPEVLRDAKAELVEALPSSGTAVLNADDPVVRTFAERTPAGRVVWYGASTLAEVRAEDVEVSRRSGAASFRLVTPDGTSEVMLAVPGAHMVPDALAAAAVGSVLGLGPEEIAGGLGRAEVAPGRMETFETPAGVKVVNDAYNANPTSMAAALKAARWMAADGRCIAVLGHMAELGPIAAEEHERVGRLAVRLGIDHLIIVGPDARRIAVGATREGLEPDRLTVCDDVEAAVAAVAEMARAGDLVLVKASRAAGLDRVSEALREGPAPGPAAEEAALP